MKINALRLALIITLIFKSSVVPVEGAGFAVLEQSVIGIGTANAGVIAGAEDLSTLYFNPAGLSEHRGTKVLSGMHIVILNAQFQGERSTDPLGAALSGGLGGNPGSTNAIPNLYLATEINDDIRIGLGINAPFGVSGNYSDDWRGRYHALSTKLTTVNINPSMSLTLNKYFSVGIGFNAQYIDLELSNAIDFGSVCLAVLQTNVCPLPGVAPQSADGEVELEAHDWSWGYNLGALFKLSSNTRIGIAYRSKISHTLQGDATYKVPNAAAPLTANGAFTTTRGQGDADLPETIAIGAFHQLNPQWAIMGDITWTRWNRFNAFKVTFKNPAQPTLVEPQNWENTFRYSIGATYQYNASWKYTVGYSYDETPIPDAEFRTARFPGSNRNWIATGLRYRHSENFNFDLSFAYVFFQDAKINRTNAQGHTLNGTFESDAYIISGQVGVRF